MAGVVASWLAMTPGVVVGSEFYLATDVDSATLLSLLLRVTAKPIQHAHWRRNGKLGFGNIAAGTEIGLWFGKKNKL